MRVLTLILAALTAFAAGPQLEEARKLYNLTDFDGSLRVLQGISQKDGATYALMGRNYYQQGDYKKASEALSTASNLDPNDSNTFLWLGRAYGRRAETSSPLTAPGYASKARQYFERAVQLNPRNLEALNDLFEYYLEAPGFLGGGQDKAAATAEKIDRISVAEGHWAHAKIAEKRKEFGSAEAQLRHAIEEAPQQVGRFIDLAHFLVKQGRIQEADQSLASAEKIAPESPSLMYAKADLYIKTKRHPELARDLLQRYIKSQLTPDDPPRSEAKKLLRQVEGS